MDIDPDYACFDVSTKEDVAPNPPPIMEKNARKEVVERIKSILTEQFDKEIEMRENELHLINDRLTKARHTMDRLRACIVASYYAKSFTKIGSKGPGTGASQHPAIQNVLRRAATAVLSKNPPLLHQSGQSKQIETEKQESRDISIESLTDPDDKEPVKIEEPAEIGKNETDKSEVKISKDKDKTNQVLGGRLRVKKTVIVGNVSKYIPADQRESTDKSTHKWMVYVRGDKENPRIDNFVRKVWFFLHPSYRPHDIVEVAEAPFHLTRRGWGEFPIRVQIHFCDRRARPVDIIHGLKLDRTYTGLQTLGAETVCEVELDQSSIQDGPNDILESELAVISAEDVGKQEPVNTEAITNPTEPIGNSEKSMEEKQVSSETLESVSCPEEYIASPASCPDRKRKLDECLQGPVEYTTTEDSDSNKESVSEQNESCTFVTPIKRRRKRRIEFTHSDDVTETRMKMDPVSEEENNEIIDRMSEVVNADPTSVKKEALEVDVSSEMEKGDKASLQEPKEIVVLSKLENDKKEDINSETTQANSAKQQVIVQPSDSIFRMRSASDGENFVKHSCDLLKSAISISPAISVRVNTSSSSSINTPSSSSTKSIILPPPNTAGALRQAPKTILVPVTPKNIEESVKSGAENKDTTSRPMIDLSTLLKTTAAKSTKPLLLKLGGPSSQSSQTFSINIVKFGNQSTTKGREKRSLSADLPSPPRLATLTPVNKIVTSRPLTPVPHVRIISTTGKSLDSNTNNPTVTPISLQALQSALSSGSVTLTQKINVKPDAYKVAGSDTNAKETKKTTPSITSSLTESKITFLKPAGKNMTNIPLKLVPEQKPDGKNSENRELPEKVPILKPLHEVIGDEIELPKNSDLNLEDILPHIVKRIPLVKKGRDISKYPFCAGTEAQYLNWNVGKQRASELKRSILIRDVLRYMIDKHNSFKPLEIPSKKFITNWCIRHGYSVFTDEYEEVQGADSNVSDEKVVTLTSRNTLMKQLEDCERDQSDEDCILVDVTSVEPSKKDSDVKKQSADDDNLVSNLPDSITDLLQSPEVAVVDNQTKKIGIPLNRAYGLPTNHLVLAKALQQFVDSLLRKSLDCHLSRRDGSSIQRIAPDEIFIRDIVDCVMNTPKFTFLTDSYLASSL